VATARRSSKPRSTPSVEGNPAYYGRFGFVRADELGLLPPPEALYDWAFQAAVLDDDAVLPQGRVVYSEPFKH
jgi:predicted N-acetyltransferase YhbS